MFAIALALSLAAPTDNGMTPLFNGKDLTGFVNVNGAPGTFYVKDGEIITTGQPTGFLRTERQYENFVLEFDWMHINKTAVANSGLFVWGDPLPAIGTPYTRGIEVQVLINYPKTEGISNHGDIFSIWGASCKPDRPNPRGWERCNPSEDRVKGAGEWNHYKVTCSDGSIKLAVNGKEVSGVSAASPRKGYLAFESEGAECHFKNVMIKELPSTNPEPKDIAEVDQGFVSIFTGLTTDGWQTEKDAWKAGGGAVRCTSDTPLTTSKKHNDCEILFDWTAGKDAKGPPTVMVGDNVIPLQKVGELGGWTRSKAIVQVDEAAPISFKAMKGLQLRSIFHRELKEK